MGGSSKQVTGYQYFANFLLFIGNPIEKLLGINFDKRAWQIGERISFGSNGEMIYIEKPNLYGENEGGVYGTLRVKHGTNTQTPCTLYKKYLDENGIPVSAYPYQSYILFGGGGFPQGAYGLSEAELEVVGDELEVNDQYYNGGFYLGNSGYMKEMLLWPKRIHIKNNGSPQWYDAKSEIINKDKNSSSYFNGVFPSLNISLTRKQGIDSAIETYSQLILSNGGSENLFSFTSIGVGTTTSNQPSSATAIAKMVSSAPGYIEMIALVDISGDLEDIAPVDDSICLRFSKQKISDDDNGSRTFLVKAIFDLVKVKIFGIKSIAKGAFKIDDESYILGSRIYNPIFNGVEASTTSFGLIGDINPIHKIREILTDDTAMNKPEHEVNDANFVKAADRVWDEGLGISWAITEKSCIDAINELCSHIEAGIRVNRQSDLYEIVLFRDDWFEDDEIHTLDESKIKSISFEVQNSDEVVNQLNVSYYDRENIKSASFSISENASIKNMQGRVNAEAADFPYFMNQRNAAVVAQWKLKQFTTPCWKGSFTTGYNHARKLNRYDIVKLNWSRKGIADLPVRIMSINLGDGVDNTVSIDFVEVVPFSNELTSSVVIDDKIDVTPLPPQSILFKAFELSYFEAVQAYGQRTVDDELAYNPDAGYVAVVAQRSQNNSLNAQMHTDAGTGYENSAVIQYCETAQLDQSIDRFVSSFIVKKIGALASVRIGSQIFINNEIMVFQGFDAASKLLTVKRGALDTIPHLHADDSLLFFADDFVAVDSTEYADGESIDVKALSTTPSGILDLSGSDTQTVTIHSRAIRPYPPANVKFNDVYYPESLIVTNDIVLSWGDRNRVQQTGGSILGFYDAGVSKETGVTYSYELKGNNVTLASGSNLTANAVTIPHTLLVANKVHILKLWSERDGFISYQIFEHAFFVEAASLILTATVTKSQVSGNTVPTANVTVNVDEALQANMKYDGSSISGKAQAGATITINIVE